MKNPPVHLNKSTLQLLQRPTQISSKSPLSKDEILTRIYTYYTFDPSRRAIRADGSCAYHTIEEGNVCPVGFFMARPDRIAHDAGMVSDMVEDGSWCDDLMRPEAQGHHWQFWNDLQEFHDDNRYWDDQGINKSGVHYFNHLKEKYSNRHVGKQTTNSAAA